MTKRLGRGLEELIPTSTQSGTNFVMLRTEQIRAGRFQPRTSMSESALEELKASIKKSGMIEPVIVRPVAHGTYELVAGERRLRASEALGVREVPAIIKTLSDKEALELSLIENVQRENLNPIEEARGYARLTDEFGYTQEQIAVAVGKDRATVANLTRLLTLPAAMQESVRDGTISLGHAKVLLSIDDRGKRERVFGRAKEGLSVRQIELLAQDAAPLKKRRARRVDPQLKPIEDELRRTLGTKVTLSPRRKGGRIIVEYFSQEDLARILQAFGVPS
jgi:ParB family chromosome partitioning protein